MKSIPALRAFFIILALTPIGIRAVVDTTIGGSLIIKQDLLVHRTVGIGRATVNGTEFPAVLVQSDSLLGSTHIDETAYGTTTTWNWLFSDGVEAKQLLQLENGGKLSLYNSTSQGTPAIVMDASTANPTITVAGKKVVTEANIGTILAGSGAGKGKLAIGENATAMGDFATSVGYGASVLGTRSTALGGNSSANQAAATAIGYWAYAGGDSSTALGYAAYTDSESSTVLGSGVHARGNNTTIVGSWASADGENSTALGSGASASRDESTAIGASTWIDGEGSTALGAMTRALGEGSTSLGRRAFANGKNSTAVGAWARTTTSYQIALGAFNKPLNDAFLMLGNGTGDEARSNLFVIIKDGRGIFRNVDYIDPVKPFPIQPKEALTVKGNASIDGTLRVRPAGDLPMGPFTSSPDGSF